MKMSNIPMEIWIGLEILVICFGCWRVYRFVKAYRQTERNLPIEYRIEAMVTNQIRNKYLATFLTRDLLIIYYLFSKSKARKAEKGMYFSLHKKMGYGGMVFGFIFVLVLEGVGVSYFLHNWSKVIAWIHLAMSIYMIAFLISDFKAIKRNPILFSEEKLYIKLGLRMKCDIDLDNIESIGNGKMHFEVDKKRKDVWNATLLDFEEPDFEIILKEPILIRDGIGRDILTKKIYLSIDEKEKFLAQFSWRDVGINSIR
jgi:hypothetical protein